MPNSKSAEKRLRQSQDRNQRNRAAKSSIRTQIRKVRTAITAGDPEAGTAELRLATKKLDQAASKRLIHPNLAARTKSRLNAALKKLQAGG